MKCKFCGSEEFVAHQVVHMDVLVDGDGNFIDNLSGGAANIYASEKPFGPFTCSRCGAEYDEANGEWEVTEAPIESCIGPDKTCLASEGKIMFRKTADTNEPGRFQRWESEEYQVCINFYSNGSVSLSIFKQMSASRYLPNLTVSITDGNKSMPYGVSVHTSYQSGRMFVPEEARKISQALAKAADYAKAIKELFIQPIRDGTFEGGGWQPQENSNNN